MKHSIQLLMLGWGMILCAALCSCEPDTTGSAKAIIGHTYIAYGSNSDHYIAYAFNTDKTATVTISDAKGIEDYKAFTYSIAKNNVEVLYDRSGYWKDEFSGTVYQSFVYKPAKDQLVDPKGVVYSRKGSGSTDPVTPPTPSGDIDKSGGLLPGVFAISATKKVRFSKGNLQYIVSSKTWRFADEQYEFIGQENLSMTKRDLFGWGTGNLPMQDSKDSKKDYTVFYEWGANTISNGGASTAWRTLTHDEWVYLLDRRPKATARMVACVAGVNGHILLPDNWEDKEGLDYYLGASLYSENNFTAAQWKKMENNGAVFFPSAGIYFNSESDKEEVAAIGKQGVYWSSTPYREQDCYSALFSEGVYNLKSTNNRCSRLSVRLVLEAQ